MKNLYLVCLLAISTLAIAQTEKMYIMKDGVAVFEKEISGIDSIIFYDPTTSSGPSFTIDGYFDDWADIPEVTGVEAWGTIEKVKAYGKGEHIYLYIEGSGLTFGEAGVCSDLLFTTDDDNTNGKHEGQFHYENDGTTLTQFDMIYRNHKGSASVFVCDGSSNQGVGPLTTFWTKSSLVPVGSNHAVEIKIPKAQMEHALSQHGKTLSTTGVRAAIWNRDGSWAKQGMFPIAKQEAGAGNWSKTTPFLITF